MEKVHSHEALHLLRSVILKGKTVKCRHKQCRRYLAVCKRHEAVNAEPPDAEVLCAMVETADPRGRQAALITVRYVAFHMCCLSCYSHSSPSSYVLAMQAVGA